MRRGGGRERRERHQRGAARVGVLSAPPHLDSEAAVASSDLELEIPFSFGPRYGGSPPRSRGEGSGMKGGQGMI